MNEDPKTQYIHENITMRIIGDHPHAGELCHPCGSDQEHIFEDILFGEKRYIVALIDCPMQVERCYAAKSNLELLDAPKQKRKVEVKHFKNRYR